MDLVNSLIIHKFHGSFEFYPRLIMNQLQKIQILKLWYVNMLFFKRRIMYFPLLPSEPLTECFHEKKKKPNSEFLWFFSGSKLVLFVYFFLSKQSDWSLKKSEFDFRENMWWAVQLPTYLNLGFIWSRIDILWIPK